MILGGFALIFGRNGGMTFWISEAGMVRVDPQVKYQYEKQNAFDPTVTHRRGAYRHDVYNLEAVVTPEEYDVLVAGLTESDTILLRYFHGSTRVQVSVKLDRLPECPDDLHEYQVKVSFSVYADYVGTPNRGVNPSVIRDVDDQIVVTGE